MKLFLLTFFGLTHVVNLVAQDSLARQKAPIVIPRLEGTITLDGASDEPAWQNVPPLPFITFLPVWGAEPTERTELRVAYDDDFLYAAGRCYTKDSATIVARNLVRDGYRGDDWMTIHIDSRFDRQNAFVFSVYPLGSRYDMATSNDAVQLGNSTFNPAFNVFWDAKTIITKEGWFFEMKIPLYNLRFKPQPNGQIAMGMSSTRAIQNKQEYHQFPSTPVNAIEPIMKPSLKQPVILTDVKRTKLFLITPYLLGANERVQQPNSDNTAINTTNTRFAQAGVDMKVGVSPYLTADISVNPDFAQVEADNQLFNLTRFSIFFPERRLFFQEQAGLFEFTLGDNTQLFYSRRIGINNGQLTNIYGGVRLTGKVSRTMDIGVLNMQSAPINLSDGTDFGTENFGVLRLRQRVLNDRSFVGSMITTRAGNANQNINYGLDAVLNPMRSQYFLFSAAHSTLSVNGVTSKNRFDASRLFFIWENRKQDRIYHRMGYTYSGKNFDPGVGFVDRTNFHNLWGRLEYGKFAKDKNRLWQYTRITLLGADSYTNVESRQPESFYARSGWQGTTFKGTQWGAQVNYTYERLATPLDFGSGVSIEPGTYTFPQITASFTPPRFRNIRVPVTATEGGFYNGRSFNFTISPTFNLGKHWEIEGTLNHTQLRFTNLQTPITIARARFAYAFDLHLSLTLIVQYNSSANQIFNNARLRYNFKDGHDLFIVWNENFFTEQRVNEQLMRPVSGTQTLLIKYFYTFIPIRKHKANS
jgi:hypothetical protein